MRPSADVEVAVARAPRLATWITWMQMARSYLRRYSPTLLLAAIVVLGLGLRVYRLPNLPAGFFCDEASVGYNAYTVLTHGVDEYGVPHPIFFRAFGEFKSPIEIYSTVPFVAIFGLDELAVRLPSAVYGCLGIVATYLLGRELFKRSRHREALGLLAALFLAISPWHIHFSRVALEGLMPWVFFVTLGLYLFLKAQERPQLLPVAIASFALALYSYFPARIFVPLFGIGLCCLFYRFFLAHKRETLLSAIVLVVLLIPFVGNLFTPDGFARWQQVSIFAHPPADEPIWRHIMANYLSHFSPDFLFTNGDIGMPGQAVLRHSVRGMGELYLFQLPLVALGIFSLLSTARRKPLAPSVLALWLLLYPVGSMFTTDDSAQATRSVIGVVPWQILSAVGLVYLYTQGAQLLRRYDAWQLRRLVAVAAGAATTAIVLVSFASYLFLYFVSYTGYASGWWGWQYGPREIVHSFVEHQGSYDDLVMAPEFNAPDIFFKFYAPDGCAKCKVGLPEDSLVPTRRQLFAITPGEAVSYTGRLRTIDTIRYPDGSVAFLLVEISSP